MHKDKDIFHKSVSLFFIGVMLLISFHNLIEHHGDLSNSQNHHCVLCHQVMMEPSPSISITKPNIVLPSKVITVIRVFFNKGTHLKHLFVRGPPLFLSFK